MANVSSLTACLVVLSIMGCGHVSATPKDAQVAPNEGRNNRGIDDEDVDVFGNHVKTQEAITTLYCNAEY